MAILIITDSVMDMVAQGIMEGHMGVGTGTEDMAHIMGDMGMVGTHIIGKIL